MLSPLIPDIKHPKWIIAQNVLERVDSKRAVKVAGRLKIRDVDYFIVSMKILLISSLFERDVSNVVSEINTSNELKRFMKIESEIKTDARLRSMIERAEAARKARVAQLAALKAAPEDTPEWRQEVADLEISLRRNGEHISGT